MPLTGIQAASEVWPRPWPIAGAAALLLAGPFRCDGADAAGVQPAAGTAHRLGLRRPHAARAPPPPPLPTPTTDRAVTSAHFAWPSGLQEADRLKGGPGVLKSKSLSHA